MIALVFISLLALISAQPGQTECDDYCQNISTTCTGANAQFPPADDDTFSICLFSCVSYPLNATLATTGDSYECRRYHLGVAGTAGQANTHCPHAGFSGAGQCGMECDAYCDNVMTACTAGDSVFEDRMQCMQECMYYPDNTTFPKASNALPRDNSVQCRAWHSAVAASNVGVDDSAVSAHCSHAAPQGAGICGTPCDNYCDNVFDVCTGDLVQWSTRDQCMDACLTWSGQTDINDPFDPETGGNTLPCRKYHAQVAGTSAQNAMDHCYHTGALGGYGVCGSECEGFCNLVTDACTTWSSTQCMTACANLTASASTLKTKSILGDSSALAKGSVACGAHYAIMAVQGTADNEYCAKAMAAMDCGAGGIIKASWTVIAVLLLALGFSS